jgi:predicted small integral membrane protein
MSKTTKAKFFVGLAGAVVQGALQFVGPDGNAGHWLSLAAAVITAIGVYAIPNKPA